VLHAELREKWKAFTENDPKAFDTYSHLFPNRVPAGIKFVTFQQAVLRDNMPTITEDESRQVQEFIDTRFKEDTELHNNPWRSTRVDETQEDEDLEMQYKAR
jgi:hypothetical protein